MMVSEIVDILLLLQYKTFLQTSNANEEIAVGFCPIQSLHRSGSMLMKSA